MYKSCYIFKCWFCFVSGEVEEIIFAVCIFSCFSLGRGMGREAAVKVHCSLTVVFSFVCPATWWLGPSEW